MWQLKEVPDKNDLLPAEWLPLVSSRGQRAQTVVDCRKHVAADHRNLVDDDGLGCPDEPLALAVLKVFQVVGRQQAGLEQEEAMDGCAADIDCRNSRRRKKHATLRGLTLKLAQDSGFSRARLPRQEDILPRKHQFERSILFIV